AGERPPEVLEPDEVRPGRAGQGHVGERGPHAVQDRPGEEHPEQHDRRRERQAAHQGPTGGAAPGAGGAPGVRGERAHDPAAATSASPAIDRTWSSKLAAAASTSADPVITDSVATWISLEIRGYTAYAGR